MRIVLDAFIDYPENQTMTLVFEPLERRANEKSTTKVSIYGRDGQQLTICVLAHELHKVLESM